MYYNAFVLVSFPDSSNLWFVNSGRTIHLLDNVGFGTSVYNIVVGQRTQDILTKTMNDPSGKFTWNSDTGNVFRGNSSSFHPVVDPKCKTTVL